MAYGDQWERDTLNRLHRWQEMRWRRELHEQSLPPDERLDEVGWDIYYCATRVMDESDAAALALDGNYHQRLRVRDDLFRRHRLVLERLYAELHPGGAGFGVFETIAPEQLDFWVQRLNNPTFIYFIQSGEDGPIKIGLSNRPERRVPELQTGNPRELLMRHVIPGNLAVEQQLHQRFEPARIRGEWFGREYLPVIIAFAGGLADRMVHAYDGSGVPPRLTGGDVRTAAELDRIRADIERLWLAGHDTTAIARLTWFTEEEVEQQLTEMREVGIYDVHRPGGFDIRGGRLVAYRSKWPRRRRPRQPPAADRA
jgi:Meiotically Up-regulated Gene 113 (MUG113) protein